MSILGSDFSPSHKLTPNTLDLNSPKTRSRNTELIINQTRKTPHLKKNTRKTLIHDKKCNNTIPLKPTINSQIKSDDTEPGKKYGFPSHRELPSHNAPSRSA